MPLTSVTALTLPTESDQLAGSVAASLVASSLRVTSTLVLDFCAAAVITGGVTSLSRTISPNKLGLLMLLAGKKVVTAIPASAPKATTYSTPTVFPTARLKSCVLSVLSNG